MPSPEQFLTALWTLEAQLPQFLEPSAVQRLQRRLEPLKQALVRGEGDGAEVGAQIDAYPSLQGPWQAALVGADPEASQAEMLAALAEMLAVSEAGTIPPQSTEATEPEDDKLDDSEVLLMPQVWGGGSKSFEGLAGAPATAPTGRRYVCPVEGCDQEWFRVGQRQPPLCQIHGKALILDPAAGHGASDGLG
jgi:hypothetical protein